MGLLLFLPPVIVAIIVAGSNVRPNLPLAAIAIVAVVEVIVIVVSVPSYGEAMAASLVVVIFPWAVVASFVRVLRRWKHRGIVAMLVLPIYVLTWGIGVVVGVNSGVLQV